MQSIFFLAARVVSIYSMLCFVRIIFTWIPQLNWSKLGQFLGAICDPFLGIFSKVPLRIGGLDFTPMLSLGLLSLLSSLLTRIASTGKLYVGGLLAALVSMLWSILSSIGGILLIALIIRFFVLIFSKSSEYYDSPWSRFDSVISPFVYKLTSIFTRGRTVQYKSAIIICIIELLVLLAAGTAASLALQILCTHIPF